jgi:hypothetical protein
LPSSSLRGLKDVPEFAAAGRTRKTPGVRGVKAGRDRARRHRQAQQRPDPFAGMTILGRP